MPNPIIQNYLNDEGIDRTKRVGVIEAMKAGQSEGELSSLITKKYGDKYGSAANNEAALAGGLPSFISPPAPTPDMKVGATKTGEQINKENNPASPMATSPVDIALENMPGFGPVFSAARQGQQIANSINPEPPADTRSVGEQLVTGAAKGLGSTAMGASELAVRGMEAATKPLVDAARPAVQSVTEPVISQLGEAPTSEEAMQNMEKTRADLTTPKGFGEQVGFGAEQIAEFLFPSALVAKGAKAAEGLNVGQKLLQLAKTGGKEALIGGAVTAAQRGNLDKEVVDTAILSGAIPVASAIFGKIGGLMKKGMGKAAEGQISKLIKPSKDAFLYGKNPSRAIIDEGIVANSFEDLTKQIDGKLDEIGTGISDAAKASSAKSKVGRIKQLIQENADEFAKTVTDENVYKTYSGRIKQLTGEFKADLASGQLAKVAEKNLDNLTAPEVWDLQRKVGKLTQWTNQAGENIVNMQLKKLYSNIGKELDSLAPGTKALQKRYANLLGSSKAAEARKVVAERNNDLVRILGGAAAGGIINPTGGDNMVSRTVNAIGGGVAFKIANSPGFRTRMAQLLGKSKAGNKALPAIVEAVLKEYSSNN